MISLATKHNDPDKTLGWGERIGYASGAFGWNMVNGIIGTFLTVYFTNVAMLDAAVISTIIAVSKLFDGVSDTRAWALEASQEKAQIITRAKAAATVHFAR